MIDLHPVTDVEQLRQAFGCYPSGVTAVCALIDGTPTGMAASSFTSVSIEPPLVSICVQNSSTTWPRLRTRSRLGLSVLAETQDDACVQLSSKNGDRFAGLSWEASTDDGIFVHGASAWLDCSVYDEVPAGDHTIVLLGIHGLCTRPGTAPLVFHGSRFHKLATI